MLNAGGNKTKRGCQWSQNAVCRILANPIYTGKIINGKEEVTDFLTGTRTEKTQEEWMITEKPELRIIEPRQFAQVQEILKSRREIFRTGGQRQSSRYLFSTLIQCKECGRSYRRMARSYKNVYIRWSCSGRNQNGAFSCPNRIAVEETELTEILENYFAELLENEGWTIQRIQKEMEKILLNQKLRDQEEKQHLLHLRKLEKRQEKYKEMFLDDLIGKEEMKEKTEAVRKEIREVQEKLQMFRIGEMTEEQIRKMLGEMYRNLKEFLSFGELKNSQLKTIIKTITADAEGKIQIYLKTAKL